jgi:hypothetical protein
MPCTSPVALGKECSPGGDAHGFKVVGVLALPGCLLHHLIGNVVARSSRRTLMLIWSLGVSSRR